MTAPKLHRRVRCAIWLGALWICVGCAAGSDLPPDAGTPLEISATQQASTGKGPVAIQVVDLQNDGRADVLVVNGLDNTLSVYIGHAAGIDATPTMTYPTGRSPSAVAAADLDGDTWPEVLVTNAGDDSVSTFKNLKQADGALQVDRVYTGIATPIAIAAADVSGDKKADVVVSSGGEQPLTVLRNDGSGVLMTGTPLAAGNYLYGVALAELATGMPPDLVTVSAGDDLVRLYVNDGSGGFGINKVDFAKDFSTPVAVVAGTLTSSGRGQDLLVANYNSDSVTLFKNRGSYGFDLQHFSTGHHPSAVAIGAINLLRGTFADFVVATADGANLFFANEHGDFIAAVDKSGAPLRLSATVPSAVAVLPSESGQNILLADREKNQLLIYTVGTAGLGGR